MANVQDGLAFWNALAQKVKALIKQESANCFRCARYDVTTAPNGTTIGVTLPLGTQEIQIPYSQEVSGAHVGDTVLVVWFGALSNAKAYYFGNGYNGSSGSTGTTNYNDLSHKPSLNGYTLVGAVTLANVGCVTSIDSSSTDTQFASAKCVYDIVGDIETLLAAI